MVHIVIYLRLNHLGERVVNFYDDLDQYSDNIAIITENGKQVSYGALKEAADHISEHVQSRQTVLLVCRNQFEAIAGYVGFLRKHIVPILINYKIDAACLGKLSESYQPAFIYCPMDWKVHGKEVFTFQGYRLLRTDNTNTYEVHPDLALLLTTSGSTGSPKFVRQSYQNIISNASSIAQYLNISVKDRPITTMPMSYTFGLSIINSHLLMGASILLTEATLMEKKFWNLLRQYEVTTFNGVPYIYEMLKKLHLAQMNLPSIRVMTQAGGKLSKELTVEFSEVCAQKGIRFIVMYGQTEATARMSYLPWEYARSKAGSIGCAIPGGKFRLSDEEGKEIEDAHVSGELIYQGDNVTMGYAHGWADLYKADENHGVLHTGDLAERDNDGFYYIVGRKKRFLKLFGNRVNLDEVEGLLNDAGYECVCAGADDHLKIYLTDRNKAEEARSFISQKTGLNLSGFTSIPIHEIPRNEAGKVLYDKLEKLYG